MVHVYNEEVHEARMKCLGRKKEDGCYSCDGCPFYKVMLDNGAISGTFIDDYGVAHTYFDESQWEIEHEEFTWKMYLEMQKNGETGD